MQPGDEERMMARVELYTTMWCGYCARARALLKRKGVAFTDIDVDLDMAKREEMVARAQGGHTVPQIFIDDEHIGGSDELLALDRSGELDQKLGIAAP
ncbi:MAG: glutaredoxin 3 [Stellaceae bacterium]